MTKQVLDSLEMHQKIQIIKTDYLKVEADYWKEQFDQERRQVVPLARCRICEQKFYADSATKHA